MFRPLFRPLRAVAIGIARWFDAEALRPEDCQGGRQQVDWVRVLPFFVMHAMCLGVLFVGISPIAIAVCAVLYFVRMFGVTAFYHRYFSHRSFRTSRPMQFVFALVANSSAQRGPLWWASHHRLHHIRSDQPTDVHSPIQQGFLWSHMGWLTCRSNFLTDQHMVHDFARYPELRLLDRFDTVVPFLLAIGLFLFGHYLGIHHPELGTHGMQMLVFGFFISTTLVFHGTSAINSVAHVIGRRPYPTKDTSGNSMLLALVTLGEGWHNNHHFYPASVRQGFRWWQVDITYYLLRVMAALGLIWDLRPVPAHVVRGQRKLRRTASDPAPAVLPGQGHKTASDTSDTSRETAAV